MNLSDRAAETGSSAVVITRAGLPVVDWTDAEGHRPIETMSVTKMVVGIVVAASLCADDRAVLDESVTKWLPEWKDDERSAISLRLLLGHRSGLKSVPALDATARPDSFAAALELPLEREPTEAFVYNNLAFNLLGGIIRREYGESLAEIAERIVFRPLGITDWEWVSDDAGNTRCHWGLMCRADDLAKIARLLLDDTGVVPDWWTQRAINSGLSCYPQVAWQRGVISSGLVEKWIAGGIDPALIAKTSALIDREMDFDDLFAELEAAFDGEAHLLGNQTNIRGLRWFEGTAGPLVAYGHDGDGGQQLLIYPDLGGVAVRQRENLDTGSMWSAFPGDAEEVLRNAVR